MRRAINKFLANQSVRYLSPLNLLYLNNPKAGCSTVKYTLWNEADRLSGKKTFRTNAHDRTDDPFVRDIFTMAPELRQRILSAKVFSIVRNPFVRILAAYLDKVGRKTTVWSAFCGKAGLKPNLRKGDVPFPDFLALIAGDADESLDPHFRPQYLNLLLPFSKPHFIFHLEDAALAERFHESIGLELLDRRRYATGSSKRLHDYYDEQSIELVQQKYAEDFRLFGYSRELTEAKEFQTADLGWQHDASEEEGLLLRWLATGKPPAEAMLPALPAGTGFFGRAANPAARIKMIKRSYERDDNVTRLQLYAKFLRGNAPDSPLLASVLGRIEELHTRRMKAVRNPDIFLSPNHVAQ